MQQIGDLGVRVTLRLDQRGDAERFLERRQILTLQVLDHGDLERMVVAYQSRNRGEAGHFRRSISALAGEQQVLIVGLALDDHGLQHAALANRLRELGQTLLVEISPRLLRIGPDVLEGQPRHQRAAALGDRSRRQQADSCLVGRGGYRPIFTHLFAAGAS